MNRRLSRYALLLAFALFCAGRSSFGQKTSQIGEIVSRAVDSAKVDNVWAVSSLGLFQSNDGGASWQKLELRDPLAQPRDVWVFREGASAEVFVATARHGLYRSRDEGRTWQEASAGLPMSSSSTGIVPLIDMASSPSAPEVLYAAAELEGIFRSENFGETWEAASAGLPVPLDHAVARPLLAVDPANSRRIFAVLAVPVHSHLVETILYRSTDGGRRWTTIKELGADRKYLRMRVDPGTIGVTDALGETVTIEDSGPDPAPDKPDPAAARDFQASLPPDRAAVAPDRDSDGIAILYDDGSLLLRTFSLSSTSITFTPVAGGGYDIATGSTALESTLGTNLSLGDETAASTTLGFNFTFFGRTYSSVFVGSNGNITFDAQDTSSVESQEAFFSGRPRIAPLWDDFNPASAGGVFVNTLADRAVFTWNGVPEYNTANSNTFQAVLFTNGVIRFNYATVAVLDGLTGISDGGRTSGQPIRFGETALVTGLAAGPVYEQFSTTPLAGSTITRRFYQSHGDYFDAVAVFGASELPDNLAGPSASAFHSGVRNDVRGIGRSVFDSTSTYGSSGRLQSYLNMNSLTMYPSDPAARLPGNNDSSVTLMGQEWGHRFLAYTRFLDNGSASTALLGRSLGHWSYFFNSDASVVEGNEWRANGDGTFTALANTARYSRLDQYLMGLRPASEVPPLLLIANPQPVVSGTIGSVISTFGRTNNAIRDPNRNFGGTDLYYSFRLALDNNVTPPLTSSNTAFITSSGRTSSGTDVNVVNTSSTLTTLYNAAAGNVYSIRKMPDSTPQSQYWNASAGNFTGANIVVSGTRRDLSVNDIIAHEGERTPAAAQSPKRFSHAFVLVAPKGKEATQADITKLANLRRAWETFFAQSTEGLASVSTSLTIRSPSQISGPILEKWTDTAFPIQWRANPATGAKVAGARPLMDVFRSAFVAWSNLTTARVSFLEDSTTGVTDAAFDGINLISVTPAQFSSDVLSLTVVYSFSESGADRFGRTIQFPGQILEADILFNPAIQYSTDLVTPANATDLQSRATHEIGHLLGLDHSGLLSAVMSPALSPGANYLRALTSDDVNRVSTIYPDGSFFSSKGAARGAVRSVNGSAVYGAHVVVVDSAGQPVASAISDPDGLYQINGLAPGGYSAYAEPLDGPLTAGAAPSLGRLNAGKAVADNLTTRFAVISAPAGQFAMSKSVGDNQEGAIGQALAAPLEVLIRDSGGNPVPGVSVSFAPTGGGGTVVPIRAATDAQGKARVQAYLGKGAVQTFAASAGMITVTFNARLP